MRSRAPQTQAAISISQRVRIPFSLDTPVTRAGLAGSLSELSAHHPPQPRAFTSPSVSFQSSRTASRLSSCHLPRSCRAAAPRLRQRSPYVASPRRSSRTLLTTHPSARAPAQTRRGSLATHRESVATTASTHGIAARPRQQPPRSTRPTPLGHEHWLASAETIVNRLRRALFKQRISAFLQEPPSKFIVRPERPPTWRWTVCPYRCCVFFGCLHSLRPDPRLHALAWTRPVKHCP